MREVTKLGEDTDGQCNAPACSGRASSYTSENLWLCKRHEEEFLEGADISYVPRNCISANCRSIGGAMHDPPGTRFCDYHKRLWRLEIIADGGFDPCPQDSLEIKDHQTSRLSNGLPTPVQDKKVPCKIEQCWTLAEYRNEFNDMYCPFHFDEWRTQYQNDGGIWPYPFVPKCAKFIRYQEDAAAKEFQCFCCKTFSDGKAVESRRVCEWCAEKHINDRQAQRDAEDDENDHDAVDHPRHYTEHPSGVECITITEHMGFTLGNVIKYVWRADMKGGLEDLKKASWYLQREISRREGNE